MDDTFQSDYVFAPFCAFPDMCLVAYAAGVVVVVLALAGVGIGWIASRLKE